MPNANLHTATVLDLERGEKVILVWTDAEDAEFEAMITKKLNRGCKRINSDGSEVWVHYEAVVDTSKEGSAQYKWDKGGNRCLHNRVVYRRWNGGSVYPEITGQSYRVLD